MFRQTPLWFIAGTGVFAGFVLLADALYSDEGKIGLAILWIIIFSTILVYDYPRDKEKKKKIAFDLSREKFGNSGVFSLKKELSVNRQISIGTEYVWKKEQIEENLFHGEWVKVVRKTESRIVVEISIRKRIPTESGERILNMRQDIKYVKPENLYPEHVINWLKFDRPQQN